MLFDHILANPFAEFSLIILVAFGLASIMRLFKQPFIVGFIITGIIFSPQFLGVNGVEKILSVSALLGVTLLLFIAGLHLNTNYLKTDGRAIIVSGLGQIFVTGLLAFGLALALSFSKTEAIYIALALTLSSTIISLKVLADRKLTTKLHARLSIGILLIQDIFVAIALIVLQTTSNTGDVGNNITSLLLENLAKAIVIAVPLILVRRLFLPRFLNKIASSQEHLFVFVISWMLICATAFELLGFSLEVGALFGGVLLASTMFANDISARIKPLRDFFLMLFFIHLGSQIIFGEIASIWLPVLLFSTFVLLGKPLIVGLILKLQGFRSEVAGRTALNLAHISEFSLILMALGRSVGVISDKTANIIVIVALISIACSTYLITYDNWILNKLSFSSKPSKSPSQMRDMETFRPKFLLAGARQSEAILKTLLQRKEDCLILDYNPDLIKNLSQKGFNCVFGNLENLNNLEGINVDELELVISTITDKQINLSALQIIKRQNPKAKYLCYCDAPQDINWLKKHGANNVLLPHNEADKQMAKLINKEL